MGARSGGGGGASGGMGSGAGGADKASRELLNAIQSGRFDKMSYAQQDKLLEAADKEASKLTENRTIYTDKEWDAIKAYEGSHYDRINAAASGTNVSRVHEQTKETIKHLESAVGRRTLKKDIIVWRGSSTEEKTSGRFFSTSLKASVAKKFSEGTHLHAYRIPKGTKYMYTEAKGEFEVVLPRNFNFNKYKIK